MSSLADRLAAASRDRAASTPTTDALPSGPERKRGAKANAESDAFRGLKANVHNRLLTQLGPQLYDSDLSQTELERMVRGRCRRRWPTTTR